MYFEGETLEYIGRRMFRKIWLIEADDREKALEIIKEHARTLWDFNGGKKIKGAPGYLFDNGKVEVNYILGDETSLKLFNTKITNMHYLS